MVVYGVADKLPNSRLVILPGLKHSILIEAPDLVVAPVRDFLMAQISG
jgi:pimeloyl-ACP methyl ester carboxylesterase